MTPLAVSLKPYLLYLIFALIFLLSMAIFVGAMLVIKRLWRKQPLEKSMIEDRAKLAAEIHQEILRLEDLRNRLDPSFVIEGVDISASPVTSKLHSQSPSAPVATTSTPAQQTGGLSEEAVRIKVEAATADLMREIADLNAKLSAKSSASNAPASNGVQEKKIQDLETQKKDLELKLGDYQAFEDEIALVKTYKDEIDRLKAQIARLKASGNAEGGDLSTGLGITEEDIASLFEEMGASHESAEPSLAPTVDSATLSSEEDLVDDIVAATLSESAGVEDQRREPSLDSSDDKDLFFKGDGPEKSPKTFVREATKNEPSLPPMNEENAEALAELGDNSDELMAEFEKVLGTKEQDKNS